VCLDKISKERVIELVKMMNFLSETKKEKYALKEEYTMEDMISFQWLEEEDKILFPIILNTTKGSYVVDDINKIPYKMSLNGYQ
jgi:hypothetical protein